MNRNDASRAPRWWPAVAVTVLYLAVVTAGRLWPDLEGQSRTMVVLVATLLWLLSMLVWWLGFSGLAWRTRLRGLLAPALAVGVFMTFFRYAGVTGDVRPIFEWRWKGAPAERVAAAPTGTVAAVALTAPGSAPGSTESDAAVTSSDPIGAPETGEPGAAPPGRDADRTLGEIAAISPAATLPADPPAPQQAPGSRQPEFPQFLGPHRDGRVEAVLEPDWQEHPPREVWRRAVGAGWSGFAVASGRAITLEREGGQDWARAYDLSTGAPLWEQPLGSSFASPLAGDGPRATPTIDRGVVFALTSLGTLAALELTSGRPLWRRDTAADAKATPPEWGYAGSPLVLDERVLVAPGGAEGLVFAYDRQSGEPVQRGGSGSAAYSSLFLTELAGSPLVVSLNADSVTGLDPSTLGERFRHPWPSPQPNVAQPLPIGGDRLLISAGYGIGAELIRVGPGSPRLSIESLWKSPRLKAKFTNVVLHEGLVYGLDDGVLVCLDPETGERRWRQGRYGHGQVLLVGDLLLVQTEDGELVLVDPNPEGLRELGRVEALDGKAWNSPAFAPPVLLVRNHREAVALELALR